MRLTWVFLAAAAVTLAATPVAAAAPPAQPASSVELTSRVSERFNDYPRSTLLDDGDRIGPWRVVFDGRSNGPSVRIRDGALRLNPAPVKRSWQTKAALVVSRARFTTRSLHVEARWTPVRTTRIGTPNPWETGWLVWDYRDNNHFTYLALKPNGWEVGRRDPTQPGGQRFIRDAAQPSTAMGQTRRVTIDRVGPQTTIRVDGEVLTTYRLPPGERNGSVGMYSEDAVVDWHHIYVATSA